MKPTLSLLTASLLAPLTPPGPPRPLNREEGFIQAEILPGKVGETRR